MKKITKRPIIIFNGRVIRPESTFQFNSKQHLSEYFDNVMIRKAATGSWDYELRIGKHDGGTILIRCHNYGDDRETGTVTVSKRKSGRMLFAFDGGWKYEYPRWVIL